MATTSSWTTYPIYTTNSNDKVEEEQLSTHTNLHAGQRGFNQLFNGITMHIYWELEYINALCINNC